MGIFVSFCKIITIVMSLATGYAYWIMLSDEDISLREKNTFFIPNLFIDAIFAFTICYMVVNKSAAINSLFEKLPFLVGLVVLNLSIKMRKIVNEDYLGWRALYYGFYHIFRFAFYIVSFNELPITYFKINGILELGVFLAMVFNGVYSYKEDKKIEPQIKMCQCNEVDQKNENLVNELKR